MNNYTVLRVNSYEQDKTEKHEIVGYLCIYMAQTSQSSDLLIH